MFMLVIADGFRRSASSPSCFDSTCRASSITRTDLVWIRNVIVPKGTGSVPFLQASENWNSSISNWRSLDLDRIDPDRVKQYEEMILEQELKKETAFSRRNNQHTILPNYRFFIIFTRLCIFIYLIIQYWSWHFI